MSSTTHHQYITSQDLRNERQKQERLAKATIYETLVMSGEKERLKQLLKQRLIESGWKDEVKQYARQVLREKGSFEALTTEDLVNKITPKAREAVPDEVKEEVLRQVRNFIEQNHLIAE